MMTTLAAWLAGGRLADVVLAATALEFLGLAALRGRGRGRLPLAAAARMLLPGVFLTLALRVALLGGAVIWVALWLALAGAAHAADLAIRWREAK